MKKVMLLTIVLFFALAFALYAQDSAKTDTKKEKKEYQNFIDKNNNGINDRLEEQQKKTARVEPKRDIEQEKIKTPDARDSDSIQKAKIDEPQSAKKKGDTKPEAQKRSRSR